MDENAKLRALATLDDRAKQVIEQLIEPLAELSRIGNEHLEIAKDDADEVYLEFDRVYWLGAVVDALPGLSGAQLRAIASVIEALPSEDEDEEPVH
jgi:hypothetical protein